MFLKLVNITRCLTIFIKHSVKTVIMFLSIFIQLFRSSSFFTDNENPQIFGCPGHIATSTDSGVATATVSWTDPTASDNSGSVSLSGSKNSGTDFPIGMTTVTYTATDGSGNSISICFFVVTVTGNVLKLIILSFLYLKQSVTWMQYR